MDDVDPSGISSWISQTMGSAWVHDWWWINGNQWHQCHHHCNPFGHPAWDQVSNSCDGYSLEWGSWRDDWDQICSHWNQKWGIILRAINMDPSRLESKLVEAKKKKWMMIKRGERVRGECMWHICSYWSAQARKVIPLSIIPLSPAMTTLPVITWQYGDYHMVYHIAGDHWCLWNLISNSDAFS